MSERAGAANAMFAPSALDGAQRPRSESAGVGLEPAGVGGPSRATRWRSVPLFWRLLGVNTVVVLGGAIIGTWLTQRLVLSGTFTPVTHALLVLAALCLSAGLTMLLLRESFRPIRSLREATRRFNAGDRSARASLAPLTDPDVAALVVDVNALGGGLEAGAG